MSATEYLGHHPYVGATVSIAHIAGAALLQVSDAELPPIVMQLFQIGAWTAAMIAAAFTCYGVWKTHHNKKGKK